jgi:mono/diheme cytochrome c family protein
MKKFLTLGLQGLAILFLIGMISCEGDIGPSGPAGPEGPAGPTGVAGEDGQDGQNGAENCIDCHGNNQLITAKIFQWENSLHYLGGHYDRNQATCAACHTSQGFLDRIATGDMAASMDIQDPLPQNCYTCHQIHTTYTSDDWALTSPDPVTLWVGGETVDIGKGNQCIICHQPRLRTPAVPTPGDTDSLTITSSFWGPHHGAQGALFTGNGAFEIGSGYNNSSHMSVVPDGCITCHMAPTLDGRAAGGHTFRVETEDGELNINGCVMCHDAGTIETLVEDTQSEIETLLTELNTKLKDKGLLANQFGSDRAVPGTYTATEVGILWNYLFVEEDQSKGVHNAIYARTLLENSIDALD